ncbi:MAG TPA: GNAT family N-acetyltransferase [Solirubrobacteraceae bacterium]|nr:GNAT family N-acetyltransferase [Solirubrobacteraceae bacterium]
MGDVDIRTAGEADLAAVLALWQADESSAVWSQDAARRLLAHDPGALLLAVSEGRIVGTLIAAWNGWRGSFYRLVSHPDLRRRGIARRLLRAGEERLVALGATRLTAIVEPSDPVASAFWEAMGYERQLYRARYVRSAGDPR